MRDIKSILFEVVYPLYVKKIERKEQKEEDLLFLMEWMTGYKKQDIKAFKGSFEIFFNEAPHLRGDLSMIKGKICGIQIETIEDPVVKYIRQLDKMVDDLAKNKSIDKIIKK